VVVLTLTARYGIGRLFGVSHHLTTLKRRRLGRGHQWQLVHDRPEPGVGFGLKAAVPCRRDEIVDRGIAGIAQGPHQGFRLVEMAHPVVTPMHDMNGDVPQAGDMVENIVVIAIRRAASAKESAIDHVVHEDPGGGQGVLLVWLTVAVFIAVEAVGAAFPGDAGPRRRGEGLGQPLDDIAAIFRRNDVDEVPPSRRKIQIGTGCRHGERVYREFGGIALEEIVDIRPAAQKDAAQDQGLHRCGMHDGVGQGEGAAPAAAKNVHLAVDVQLVTQRRHVIDQMLGRIVGQRRCCVIIARTGRTLAATALVEKHDAVSLRIEKPGGRAVAAGTRPAMHDNDRLAGERAVFLPIDTMLGKSRRSQMARPDEGWVRRLAVWRGRLGACIHGIISATNGM